VTDAFFPMSLRLVPEPPLATATCEPSLDFLTGRALRAVIAERLEQIERHGHLPDTDMGYQQGELALAAKTYLDTYIDLELRPEHAPPEGEVPETWPFADLFWKEPSPEQRAKALIKSLALGLAELDRLLASLDLIHAARPLVDQSEPPQFTPAPANGAWHL